MIKNNRFDLKPGLRAVLCLVTLFASVFAGIRAAAETRAECIQALSHDKELDMSADGLERMFKNYDKYAGSISNKDYVLFVDYSRNSKHKRSYLIKIKDCSVVNFEYAIHGGHYTDPKTKKVFMGGDPNHDGKLDKCKINGSSHNMTRPGPYITAGCHTTAKKNWTKLWTETKPEKKICQGIALHGMLEGINDPATAAGVVLHEHTFIQQNEKVKPVGQGCPAYAPGRLKGMLRYKIETGTLLYVYAPQCGGN